MFEQYRVNEKRDVIPPIEVFISKKFITRKEVLNCKVLLIYSSGFTPEEDIIFLAKILTGKYLNKLIPITEKDIV